MRQADITRVLIVEDEQEMALLLERLLARKVGAESDVAGDCASARDMAASGAYDVITLDYQLPDGDGLGLLEEIRAMENPPPVVMVTGHGDERTAVDSFELGASGYVVKDKRLSTMLPRAITHALSETSLRDAEEALGESLQRFEDVAENSAVWIWEVDHRGEYTYASHVVERVLGYRPEELVGKHFYDFFHPEDREELEKAALEVFKRKEPFVGLVNRNSAKDGHDVWLSTSGVPILGENGELLGYRGADTDITERRSAERLIEVQRDLAVKLSGAADLEETLEIAMDAILEATVFDCGGVYLVNGETGTLELVYHVGLSDTFAGEVTALDAGTPNARLVNEGKSLFTKYVDLPVPMNDARRDEGLKAFGLVPITDRGSVIGCLNVASHTVTDVPEESGKAAESLAEVIGRSVERSRLVTALAESEERHRLLYENAGAAIFTFDRNLVVTGVNKAGCKESGYDEDEIVGKNIFELGILHRGDAEKVADNIPRVMSGETVREKVRLVRKDGSAMVADVVGVALFKGSEVVEIVNIFNDVTGRDQSEAVLRKSNEELRGYAEVASHDLKGPLSAITLAADMLHESLEALKSGKPESTSAIEQVVSSIERNALNASRRVNELLALAEAGQVPRDAVLTDLDEIVVEVLAERSKEIDERRVRVLVDTDLGTVTASPTHIRLIFSNLISNAIIHNGVEAPEVRVSRLGPDKAGGQRYLVRDNGHGIPEESMRTLFFPFYKGKKSGGTGVGLATVEKIIKVYGGSIEAYNNNGACFEFTLRDFQPPEV